MSAETVANDVIDVHGHVPTDRTLIAPMLDAARGCGVRLLYLSSIGVSDWPAFPADDHIARANDDAFDLCRRHPDLLRAYAYLNPNGQWETELDRRHADPFFVGVKLWISLRNDRGEPGICLPILRRAAGEGFPVLIHSFFRHGGNMPGELSPAEIAALAAEVPDAAVIMAHMGFSWERAAHAVADRSNVRIDCSGGPAFRGAVEAFVRCCGPHRVLFGSDVPCRTIQSQLAKVFAADLPADAKRLILSANAERLFPLCKTTRGVPYKADS